MRGATLPFRAYAMIWNISTHTPHAGRDREHFGHSVINFISTHTPHAGRDLFVVVMELKGVHFYSHAPCGARQRTRVDVSQVVQFLLTRPMRGATRYFDKCMDALDISTHTPHAGRDFANLGEQPIKNISTHTPHAGRDKTVSRAKDYASISTHTPHAGRDQFQHQTVHNSIISTHTPHAGRD